MCGRVENYLLLLQDKRSNTGPDELHHDLCRAVKLWATSCVRSDAFSALQQQQCQQHQQSSSAVQAVLHWCSAHLVPCIVDDEAQHAAAAGAACRLLGVVLAVLGDVFYLDVQDASLCDTLAGMLLDLLQQLMLIDDGCSNMNRHCQRKVVLPHILPSLHRIAALLPVRHAQGTGKLCGTLLQWLLLQMDTAESVDSSNGCTASVSAQCARTLLSFTGSLVSGRFGSSSSRSLQEDHADVLRDVLLRVVREMETTFSCSALTSSSSSSSPCAPKDLLVSTSGLFVLDLLSEDRILARSAANIADVECMHQQKQLQGSLLGAAAAARTRPMTTATSFTEMMELLRKNLNPGDSGDENISSPTMLSAGTGGKSGVAPAVDQNANTVNLQEGFAVDMLPAAGII